MAKDKPLKPDTILSKRKKLSKISIEVNVEDTMDTKVRKKKIKIEEIQVAIPHKTMATSDKKWTKDKKQKKKQMAEQMEISDSLHSPEGELVAEGEEDLSPKDRRTLERKTKILKKEKKRKKLKAKGESLAKTEASAPTAPQQALDYLTCWADNRTEWKFQKTRQTWLLQHMFDSDKIAEDKFSVLLQYLEGLRGGAKNTTVQKALALVEESGRAPDDGVVQQRADRAREVIQLLS